MAGKSLKVMLNQALTPDAMFLFRLKKNAGDRASVPRCRKNLRASVQAELDKADAALGPAKNLAPLDVINRSLTIVETPSSKRIKNYC